ncbi:MAG: hypothetical protein Q7R87_01315 [Nanoarchaeota archaeon]|nr:hypothetical protein [Nanoarchaeota archaeon]
MYLILKDNYLRRILDKAFKKAGNIRKLSKIVSIPRSTLSSYHMEQHLINESNLSKLEKYLKINIKKSNILRKLPNNWKQIKGGKNRVIKSLKEGTFNNQLEKARKKAGKKNSEWHKFMKKTNPEKYYNSQYEKFKKIAEYKYKSKNGEKVRNKLEKETADKLKEMNIKYEYEPYILHKNKAFFPDFLIKDKIIIECTAWRGYDKAIKLKKRINHLKDKYEVYVLIPKALNKYYQILNKSLIFELDKKMFP